MNILASILLLHTASNKKILEYQGLEKHIQRVLGSIGSCTSQEEIHVVVEKIREKYPNGLDPTLLRLTRLTKLLPSSTTITGIFGIPGIIRPCTKGKLASFAVLREVWSEINGKEVFRVYETKPSSVTLFSEQDGRPLFHLNLQVKEKEKVTHSTEVAEVVAGAGMIPTCPEYSPLIRFLINRNEQVLLPSFYNLTSTTLNVLLFHEHQVMNQVNVLRSFRSYTVPADQRTQKEMVLTIFETPTEKKKLTTQEDELTFHIRENHEKPKGLYWQLKLFPERNQDNHLWKHTSWVCQQFLITRDPAEHNDYPPEDSDDENEIKFKRGKEKDMDEEAEKEKFEEESDRSEEDEAGFRSLFHDDDDEDEPVTVPAPIPTPAVLRSSETEIRKLDESLVKKSNVCHVTSGQQVTVNSVHAELDINYDLSAQCYLHLAVHEGMKMLSSVSQIPQIDHHHLIEEYLNNKWKAYLAPKNFQSESCAICLGAPKSTSPFPTFHPCGHQCVHGSCLSQLNSQTCPLCRSIIAVVLSG